MNTHIVLKLILIALNFKAIRTSGRDIYNGEITLKEADEYQTSL